MILNINSPELKFDPELAKLFDDVYFRDSYSMDGVEVERIRATIMEIRYKTELSSTFPGLTDYKWHIRLHYDYWLSDKTQWNSVGWIANKYDKLESSNLKTRSILDAFTQTKTFEWLEANSPIELMLWLKSKNPKEEFRGRIAGKSFGF